MQVVKLAESYNYMIRMLLYTSYLIEKSLIEEEVEKRPLPLVHNLNLQGLGCTSLHYMIILKTRENKKKMWSAYVIKEKLISPLISPTHYIVFNYIKKAHYLLKKTSTLLVTKKGCQESTILSDHYDQYLTCSYCVKSKKNSLALVCLLMTAFFLFYWAHCSTSKTPNSL